MAEFGNVLEKSLISRETSSAFPPKYITAFRPVAGRVDTRTVPEPDVSVMMEPSWFERGCGK
jgi:hypothetical protein